MAKRPDWLDDAVFYEIYPQSFKDTDGDGIGNINGITEKLPYIKELGCTAIWINPCFESPFLDAGYDVSDYCRVAPDTAQMTTSSVCSRRLTSWVCTFCLTSCRGTPHGSTPGSKKA